MSPAPIIRTWIFLLLWTLATPAGAQSRWAVHEWGTFTSLQDESGAALGGINTDDEPVPQFVHRLAHFLLLRPGEVPGIFFQGAPRCHPDVTMRLETPVIYFHPPESETNITRAEVRVKFHGGWLSEFYPDAVPDAPGLKEERFRFGPLSFNTTSTLDWPQIQIGGPWPLTNTTAHVWTSPRAVRAALVQTTNGESEKFLFYRGVAHLDAPLRIARDPKTDELLIHGQLEVPTDKPPMIPAAWLVDIRPTEAIAFRPLPALTKTPISNQLLTRTPASFGAEHYSTDNLPRLKAALLKALVNDGLFLDEAHALLNTWELSYFKSAGLRVFFIVPRAWTDHYLPLDVSLPADIQRVMVGRIELVTPAQRAGLKQIAGFTTSEIHLGAGQLHTNYYAQLMRNNPAVRESDTGRKRLAEVISVPRTYQTYLDLGRFRNALILDEANRHHAAGLTNFIATYGLKAYLPLETPSEPKN